ncbi:50S ribosomal protein L25/general stress protein Ctc [Bacteroidetes bacterium endosymbiont of Geopemphigus sp.]|uniref:50S ribosomal protein L25/general stress protein Ctc n=1 Tax=Bacteroidetes bacterium endosymbiont of Geopemphigus sp. TaxID=2047937 RepID=UPI000CD12BD5|nr:50S ribosomal protein L25/general stress protein Ctc [Bacteroidetes bacterium endosymbiont of Geopemphigus sp.]
MKSITIQGEKRENVGKSSTRALRDAEQVPCVVYGNGESIHFSTALSSFKNLVYTPEAHTVVIKWSDGGKTEAVLQDVQFHPVSDLILHADFCPLQPEKPVIMEIPVKVLGRSIGVSQGGVLRLTFRKLKVKTLPENLPDNIEINITSLAIGARISVKDLSTDKYSIEHPKDTVIVAVKASRAAVKSVQNDVKGKDDKKAK